MFRISISDAAAPEAMRLDAAYIRELASCFAPRDDGSDFVCGTTDGATIYKALKMLGAVMEGRSLVLVLDV